MEAEIFRAGMRRLAGGVTIITSADAQGRRCGITATAVSSLAAEPPSLIACVNINTSVGLVAPETGRFCVNVLADGQRAVADAFAGRTGLAREDRFQVGDWDRLETGAPALRGALVNFDCRLADMMEHATHRILIGRIVATRLGPADTLPLVYGEGSYLGVCASPPSFADGSRAAARG